MLFAMLGDAGPDHLVTEPEDFHVFHQHGFLYPLDEYIFDVLRDKSGRPVDPDGHRLDPTESGLFYRDSQTGKYGVAVSINRRVSISPEWDILPALLRVTAIREGKVFGMPVLKGGTCLIYRKDLFREAGLDPESPPTDWDAFLYCAQKLTEPDKPIRGAPVQKGQRGVACGIDPALEWLNYLWQAGGHAVRKVKSCPAGHRIAVRKEAESPATCSVCAKGLLEVRESWSPALHSDAGVVALTYYHRLRMLRWTRCPGCGEPVNLLTAARTPSFLSCNGPKGCGQTFPLPPDDRVYRGVVRKLADEAPLVRRETVAGLFQRGEVAIVIASQPYPFAAQVTLSSENIGMAPLPAGWQWVGCPHCGDPIILTREMMASGRAVCPRDSAYVDLAGARLHGGVSANSLGVDMWSVSASSSKQRRDAVWRLIEHRLGDTGVAARVQSFVDGGHSRCVPPSDLLRAQHANLYRDLPKSWIAVEQQCLSSGRLVPWVPGWTDFATLGLSRLLKASGPRGEAEAKASLVEAATECVKTFRAEDSIISQRQQQGVLGVLIPLAALILIAIWYLYRGFLSRRFDTIPSAENSMKSQALAWMLLAPAVVLLVAWVGLPLFRGLYMAFLDTPVAGERQFLGVLNFATLLSSSAFWRVLLQTGIFVAITLLLGFAAPLLLALVLAEVPRGKSLFRTVFYLPALSSGLAVAILWKLMLRPTDTGFLNWLLLHMPRVAYFLLPALLMAASAGFSALFFRRGEFLPGVVFLLFSAGMVLLIPQIQPLKRPVNWLGNPAAGGIWTMLCVVFPAAWASAGPGSLVYLAALRGVPGELYDAAELDGAGILAKTRHIVLAELRPLIILNLLGAVVGASQAIRNIFVMTGGEPGGKTNVLALDFWYGAFIHLRLGYATALAWVLASMVIGLSVCHLRRMHGLHLRNPRITASLSRGQDRAIRQI